MTEPIKEYDDGMLKSEIHYTKGGIKTLNIYTIGTALGGKILAYDDLGKIKNTIILATLHDKGMWDKMYNISWD